MRFKGFKKISIFVLVLGTLFSFSLSSVSAAWENVGSSRSDEYGAFEIWQDKDLKITEYRRDGQVLHRFEWDVSSEDLGEYSGTDIWGRAIYIDKNGKQTTVDQEGNKSAPTDIASFVGWILYWIASFFSVLVGLLIKVLVEVASYNNFLNHRIVLTGWQIIRDICNNFFIVGLLVISVATILRQPASYQYQQALGKLLVMAVLINFSKLFTGILIDVSQVITIYFANALTTEGGNIILYALGLHDLYQAQANGDPDAWNGYGGAVWTLLYALILSVIAAVVVVSIVLVLVYRIVTLWFLVILSPAAFLAKAIPGQEKYFSEWLSTLSKELIVAPVMLFFLYLSLFAGAIDPRDASGSVGSPDTALTSISVGSGNSALFGPDGKPISGGFETAVGSPVKLLDFLLIVGLLVGSLVAGQRVGAKGSSWAGSGVAKLDSWRKKGKALTVDKAIDTAKDAAKNTALGAWSITKATGRGIDKAILGGRAGGVIATANSKGGAVGAIAGGALGAIASPAGVIAGAAVGSWIAGKITKSTSEMMQRQRTIQQNRYKASINEGKTDEALDEKGERAGLQVVRDAAGKITAVKDSTGAAITDINKKINLWNEDKGIYERAKLDATTGQWDFDREREIIQGGEQARDKAGNIITVAPGATVLPGAQLLKADGTYTTSKADAAYKFDSATRSYVKLEDDQVLRKEDGTAQTRWAEYEGPDGRKYRKISEDAKKYGDMAGAYYEFDGGKNQLVKDASGQIIPAATAFGSAVKAMSSTGQAFYNGYSSGMNKSYSAASAAEAEKIGKIQKDFEGLPKEQLRQLLDVERDGAKLTAIALTMGLKKSFKETDVAGVNKAKEALQSNPVLLKQFNDEMNKKFAVLNNSRLNTAGGVEINDAELAKMVSAGDMKWSEQNTKQMTPEALKIMAKQMGVNFHKELEKMIKTDRDKIAIGGALDKNIASLGFSSEDLSLRKSAGAINGDWIKAFSALDTTPGARPGTLKLNKAALATAIKQIPKPEVFATVSDSNFNDLDFQEAIAVSMDVGMLNKMSKNYDMSSEKMRRYAEMIKSFAGTATANKTGTPAQRAAYLRDQARASSNSELAALFT